MCVCVPVLYPRYIDDIFASNIDIDIAFYQNRYQ